MRLIARPYMQLNILNINLVQVSIKKYKPGANAQAQKVCLSKWWTKI